MVASTNSKKSRKNVKKAPKRSIDQTVKIRRVVASSRPPWLQYLHDNKARIKFGAITTGIIVIIILGVMSLI